MIKTPSYSIWKENLRKTIEFISTIHQGVIVIPQEYQGKLEQAQVG